MLDISHKQLCYAEFNYIIWFCSNMSILQSSSVIERAVFFLCLCHFLHTYTHGRRKKKNSTSRTPHVQSFFFLLPFRSCFPLRIFCSFLRFVFFFLAALSFLMLLLVLLLLSSILHSVGCAFGKFFAKNCQKHVVDIKAEKLLNYDSYFESVFAHDF